MGVPSGRQATTGAVRLGARRTLRQVSPLATVPREAEAGAGADAGAGASGGAEAAGAGRPVDGGASEAAGFRKSATTQPSPSSRSQDRPSASRGPSTTATRV